MLDDLRARSALHVAALIIACSSHEHPGDSGSTRGHPRSIAPFVCDESTCVQRHPRLPDDGEWTCSDTGGVAICVGGDPPAGVPKNVPDPAWVCGLRRVGDARPSGERVCVDVASDFPDSGARGWSCRYTTEQGLARVCRHDPNAHQIGDPCDRGHPCLDGFSCAGSRCVAEHRSPSCAFDRDCASRVCRLGTCRTGAP